MPSLTLVSNPWQTQAAGFNSLPQDQVPQQDMIQLRDDIVKFANTAAGCLSDENDVANGNLDEEKNSLVMRLNTGLNANPETTHLSEQLTAILNKSNNISAQLPEINKMIKVLQSGKHELYNLATQRQTIAGFLPADNNIIHTGSNVQFRNADINHCVTTLPYARTKLMQDLKDFNEAGKSFINNNLKDNVSVSAAALAGNWARTSKTAPDGSVSLATNSNFAKEFPVALAELMVAELVLNENTEVAKLNAELAGFAATILSDLNTFQKFIPQISSFYKAMLGIANDYSSATGGSGSQTTLSWNDPKMGLYFAIYCSLNPGVASKYPGSFTNNSGQFILGLPEQDVPPFLLPYCTPSSGVNHTVNFNYDYYEGASVGTHFYIALPPYVDSSGQVVVAVHSVEKDGSDSSYHQVPVQLGPAEPGESKAQQYENATIDLSYDGGPDDLKLSDIINNTGHGHSETGNFGTYSVPVPTNTVYITSATLVAAVSLISDAIGLVLPGYDLAGSWSQGLTNSGNVTGFAEQLENASTSLNNTISSYGSGISSSQNEIQKMMNNFTSYLQSARSKQIYSIR